jgi:hypothetical protein
MYSSLAITQITKVVPGHYSVLCQLTSIHLPPPPPHPAPHITVAGKQCPSWGGPPFTLPVHGLATPLEWIHRPPPVSHDRDHSESIPNAGCFVHVKEKDDKAN